MKFSSPILIVLLAGCVQPGDDAVNAPGNRDPVIGSLTASPSSVDVGSSSTITVVATDPENQPLSYKWSASTGDIIGEGPSVRFSASFCCRGPNYVQVTVKDNAGGSTTQQVDVFINY
ncbi:MAG: hypothetical protein KIT50_01570 [Bacteroidetes bacterium]|nr:hypothetical protein [Bacteroidota bacterium]